MPESNLQNFEISQDANPLEVPGKTKKNKSLYILIPMAIFLVVLALFLSTPDKNYPKPPITVSRGPSTTPTPVPVFRQVDIATTSAFYPFTQALPEVINQLDNLDLQLSSLAIPRLDLKLSF